MARLIAPIGVLMALCACQDAERPASEFPAAQTAPAQGVVARFEGGEITIGDVDARILGLPANERPAPGADLDAWYGGLIRELVVDRELLESARREGLSDSEAFRLRRIAIERQLAVQSCLADYEDGLAAVTSEELDAAYDERQNDFVAPERRSTFHLYLREEAGDSTASLLARMGDIRDRALRGESFQRLAQSESDSETRHRQGGIGWVVRGQLPERFEEVVFSLEEGVPSQPLVDSGGVHLFQVEDILPERQLSRSEVANNLRAQLEADRIAVALDEVAAMNPSPKASIVDRETLERLVEEGEEQATVLVTDDYELSLEAFRLRLGRVLGEEAPAGEAGPGRISNDLAWQFINRLHRHEAAYEYCSSEGLVAQEAVARQVGAWQNRALTDRMRQRLLRERVLADTGRLELYYQSNIGQFTPPVEWQLERLRVPFDSAQEGKTLMARLEAASVANEVGLEALQQEVGGTLEPLGWLTLAQMRRINAKLPQRVAPLETGELVAPLRVGDLLEIYRTTGRMQPDPEPFEAVRDAVASAYLRQYTREVYEKVEAEILERADFELYSERLDALRDAGFSAPEITAEQLDALLSGSR